MEEIQTSAVLFKFIKQLKIQVSRNSVDDELFKHPSYPSLLAVSDVLHNWRVPNGAYGVTYEQLSEVDFPYLAALNTNEFVIVTHSNAETFTVITDAGNKIYKTDEFKTLYSGSILVAQTEPESGETDYRTKYRQELLESLRKPLIATGFLLVVAALLINSSYFQAISLSTAWLTVCKSAGLLVTILLLIQSVDSNNPLIQKLCSSGDKNNCNAILSSSAAKITAELSWSEAGFFYFAGTWLAVLFNSTNIGVMHVLAILNVIALPYTFYSVYYQWRVAKQWCLFCCCVQILLWFEFIGFIPFLTINVFPVGLQWLNIVSAMSIPLLVWGFVKPLFLQARQIQPLKQQLRQFKYNQDYFEKTIAESPKYTLPGEEYTILLGNREAENIITIVSNPYCEPCSSAHKALDEWIDKRDDIKLQVVFAANDDSKSKVARHILALKENDGDEAVKHALSNWYGQSIKNLDDWIKRYPVQYDADSNAKALSTQNEWCELVEITSTPTIFVNGRRLPQPYRAEDIKYFI
ncbi:MAG: hypothetical protein EOP46_07600 [Sphingobacteriaceae bacterium]|nr:MAG: hypothetical protein EOP46_07600 [Sphingobacteriaceae bacterium]